MSKKDRKPRIAVVEDNDDFRFLLRLWLSRRFEVSAYQTGEDLLARLGSERPRLVILDLNLPGRDGLQIAAAIRRHEAHAKVPILFLTGLPRSSFESALSDPNTAYLSKPLQLACLVEWVDRLLAETAVPREAAKHHAR